MQEFSQVFKGKKITVMGLGLLGRGVGDAKFLAGQGAELIVTDLKSEEELAESLEKLQGFSNITYVLGEHRMEDFQNRDYVLKAAGVPLDSPYIAEAEKQGIPIKMSASWFAELAGITTIGITGTRGKSTVTHMLHDILKAAGKRVLLGGNVRGVSTLALLPEVTQDSVALMELDSWQCQGFGDSKMSPDIAVFTTLYDDHLNYYHGDRGQYLEDKAQIFLHQKPGDTFILGHQAESVVTEKYGNRFPVPPDIRGIMALPDAVQLRIPGEHNRYDAALARAAAEALAIDNETIQKALEQFTGVPGRLAFIREVNGVKFYNDTTATSPDATLAALRALGESNKIILIMGGADKGLDMNRLLVEIPKYTKRVVMLPGTGTDRALEFLPGVSVFSDLAAAFSEAVQSAELGDVVLLSPAFASFGLFKNEFDRGDQFTALVNKI